MSNVSIEEREIEEKRLAIVLAEIRKQINGAEEESHRFKDFLLGSSKDMWTEFPHEPSSFEEMVDLAGGLRQVKSIAAQHAFLRRRLKQLLALANSPYFARIDLKEIERGRRRIGPGPLETPARRIYIGLSSLTHGSSGEHLIYDWRAPISSVYYDYEIGPVEYTAPIGTVKGEMLLKRHFRIRDGHIDVIFDNSLTIYDEMLLDVLKEAKGSRMRNVVNTIQREQNKVIRGEAKGALLVQGAAGSGKTVIALHRAAYLLYKYRNVMSSRNIILFSPGKVFLDYTSPVLPELGEEPIQQATFTDLASSIIEGGSAFLSVEEMGDQLEYLYERRHSAGYKTRIKGIAMKAQKKFAHLLRRYVEKTVESQKGPGDLVFQGKTVLSNNESLQMLRTEYVYLPPEERVNKIQRRALWLLDRIVEERIPMIRKEILERKDSAFLLGSEIRRMAVAGANEEVQGLRDRILRWRLSSAFEAYVELFKDKKLFEDLISCLQSSDEPNAKAEMDASGYASDRFSSWLKDYEEVSEDTLQRLQSGVVPYEDLAPILLLKGLLEGPYSDFEPIRRDSEATRLMDSSEGETNLKNTLSENENTGVIRDRHAPGQTPSLWMREIKHVIVDEVQDYSPIQHEVLKLYFRGASFTLLGDVNQCANPAAGFRNVEDLYSSCQGVYEDKGKALSFVTLDTSYRSTKEITEFTRGILGSTHEIEAVERSGEPPLVMSCPDRESLAETLFNDVRSLQEEGYGSIAIICKTARESWALYDDLKALEKSSSEGKKGSFGSAEKKGLAQSIHLVTPRDRRFRRGVLIFPSYLAKGLEFEAVIVYNASEKNYSEDEDREILYTACTRALHRLHIYYVGKPSRFIPLSYLPTK